MPSKPEDQPQRPTPAVGQVWRDSAGEFLIAEDFEDGYIDAVYADGTTVHGVNPLSVIQNTYVGKWTGKFPVEGE